MFVLKRRNIIIVSVMLVTIMAFIVCFGALGAKNVGALEGGSITVVLDAGHGGVDGGVTGVKTGVKESELNLKVVKKLENYFVSAGIVVVLTRSSDAGLYGVASSTLKSKDMKKRKEIINSAKPTLVISVHMNKYSTSTRRGAQVFYKSGDNYGKSLAQNIQNSFNDMPTASRECSILTGDYYILNCSKYPSVIAECGFLSNPEDEALLVTDEYQENIAYAIFKGAIGYMTENSFKYY